MKQLFVILNWKGDKVKGTGFETKAKAKEFRNEMNKEAKNGKFYTVGISIQHWRYKS